MTLADIARVVGTVAALAGIVLTAPAAFGVLWDDCGSAVKAIRSWLAERVRSALGRRSPADQVIHAGSVGGGIAGLNARVMTRSSGFASPGLDAPVEDHLRELWARMAKLATEIESVRSVGEQRSAELREQITGVEARVDGAEKRLGGQITKMHAELRSTQKRSIRIYAYGLPAIMLGVLLTGLPDRWVAQLWVTWPLVGAVPIGMAYGVGKLWAERSSLRLTA